MTKFRLTGKQTSGLLILALFLLALSTKFYSGWGEEFVHGYVGDFLAVVILVLSLNLVWPKLGSGRAALAVLAVAVGIEFLQLILSQMGLAWPDNFWLSIIFGGTFDPLDLAVYAVGAGVGWGVGLMWTKLKDL